MVPILAVVAALGAVLLGPCRVIADPGPVGSEFRLSDDTPGYANVGGLAMNPGGDFIVVWTEPDASSRGVYARRFDPTAQPIGAPFQVNTYTTGEQRGGGVAAAASGDFVAVWSSQDGSSGGVFAQRFTNIGVPVGGEFQVNTYTTSSQSSPAVAVDPTGKLLIAWESRQVGGSDNGIFAQRYDAAGVPQGSEFQVNTTSNFEAGPRVAADGAGNFVVVWADFTGGGISTRILAQRFDASGAPIAGEFQVNVVTAGFTHRDPAVATTAAGGFVIVWTDESEILARRYDASGTPLAAPFQVAPSDGGRAAVATNAAGAFVVVWVGEDGDRSGVFGRRFDATGTPLSAAFQVNTYTPEDQSDPIVGVDSTGAFVVFWNSPQDADELGVFGQRFDAAGNPVPRRVPMSGASLTIVDGGPTRRSIKFRAKNGKAGNGINPVISPTIQGATLQVFNASGSGDSACFTLPASGWQNIGSAEDPLFVYRDRDFANGPCNLARIWRGRFVRASCSSKVHPVTYTLDEPMQGSVGVGITVGPATYCTVFGGTVHIDDTTRHRFRATAAPEPPACPVPPAACP